MSIASLAVRNVKPVSAVTQVADTAIKLRQLMPKRDAIRLATALYHKDPGHLPIGDMLFRLRKGTTDIYTFRDVFLQDSMRFVGDSKLAPSCIVDCGAHIGCTSLFFALRYPGTKIIAVEPDPWNFELLSANVCQFPNVVPINAAVWDRPTCVQIANPGTNPTGLYVEETTHMDGTELPAITIPEIMKKAGVDQIDILKIDVEGAELRLF